MHISVIHYGDKEDNDEEFKQTSLSRCSCRHCDHRSDDGSDDASEDESGDEFSDSDPEHNDGLQSS